MGDNGFAENITAIATNMEHTRALLREATVELNRRQALIAELASHLKVIVHEYDNTYDGDQDSDGRWTAAASIPVQTMEAAKRLVEQL